MSAMKRELERISETLLTGDYEAIRQELMHAQDLGLDLEGVALLIDTAKAIAPNCNCGANYFEGIQK